MIVRFSLYYLPPLSIMAFTNLSKSSLGISIDNLNFMF